MATERRETGRRWGRVARRALVCAYAAACVPGARAASFTALGHYGFVTLKADETPGATAFTARVESPSGTGDVRRVYARSVADGWQIYVGGWPAAAQGLADLVLLAQGPDGTRDVRFSRTVQTTAGRIDVALVIDDSYSMRKTDPLRLRVKALTLFARLAASRGVVRTLSVIAFERRPRLVLPPTPPDDADAFERALGALVARGSTDLDAALILAEKTLASLPDSRKIVVVLSDGKDEPGRYESAHRRFTASRIPVYTVGLSKLADRTTLERIAQETGGTFSFAPDMTRLEAIFQEIVLAIHPAVRIGTWDLTVDDAGVPIDESVRLLTLKLTADEDAQAVVMPPDGGGDTVALRTAHAAEALAEQYAPARGLWRATGLGVLAATAESDLELVLFPPTGMATDAVPHAVAALVLRDGEAMTNGCEVSLVTTAGGAQQRLEATGRGYFEGYAVPSGAGTMDWQVTVRGVTRADYPFQRVTAQEQPVVPMRRDALWVRPEPLRLELDPGCTVTGRVVIAGRGRFSAEVEGVGEEIGEGVASLLRRAGDIPEGRPLDLGLVITAGSDARPGVVTGRVVVTVGKLPRAEVRVSLRIRAPPIAIGPERLEWPHVAPGQVVTGTVWGVVQAADNACRVRGVTQGFDGHPGRVRDVTLGVETTRWHVVVETAGIGATTQLTGRVAISWGWDGVEVPWTVAVVVPTPEPEPEPVVIVEPEPEVEHQPAIEPPLSETKSDTDVAPEAAVDEPAHPATPPVAVASPKAPPETPPVTPPVAQARYNKWRIAAVLLLLLMLLLLLWRMTRGDGNRLTKFFAASLVVHLLVFLLTLDLLLQTRVVTLQQISPTLAVTIAAMEEKLGFAIAPASGPVAVQDTQSEPDAVAKAEIAREAEEAREAADLAQPDRSAEAVAAMEALEREQNPEALERQADDVVRETTPAEAPAEEALAVEAKRRESEQAAERARAIEALRAESVEQRTEERREMQAAVTDNAAVQDVSVTAEQIERRAAEALRAAAEAAEREQPRTPEDIQEEIRQTAGKHSERPDEAEAARQVDLQRVEADGGAVERKTTAEAVAPVAAGSDAARDVAALVTAGGAERAVPEAARGEANGPERQTARPAAVAAEAITLAAGAQRRAAGEPGAAAVKPSAAAVARASESDGGPEERKTAKAVAAGSAEARRPDAVRDVAISLPTATDQPQQRHDGTAGDLALKSGGGGQGTVSATLALAQYGGDWDCARTAMMFLSHQLRERTGMALMAGDTVIRLDQPELHRLPFVYLTGHNDFHFTDAEVRNLRDYLQQGGHLWADDSTHYRDETFDRAFRREIARVLPDAAIERLDARFGGWRTGYDLTHGYKEYAIPPGDKYRQNFIEGIRMGDRVAVVYTRNDYGDGLNIDPHTQPLKDSLTSLSPAEMQEGATRMGINLVLYFLSQHGGIDLPFVEKAASGMRGAADPSAVALPEGTTRPVSEAGDAAAWFYEEWGDPAEGVEADGRFVVRFQVGAQEKAAFGRMCEPPLSLKPGDTLAFDVESLLPCGARVALGLDIGGHYLETAPFYIKPGVNAAFFVCSTKTFKSETTAWEYREALPLPAEINKINLLIYAPAGGELRFGNFRIVGQ